jgi:hypothetical protein
VLPEPGPHLGEYGGGLGAAELGQARARGVLVGATVDVVERTDPCERLVGVGMVGLRLLELAVDVRPAAGEDDARAVARAGGVGLERVAGDRAGVVADDTGAEPIRTSYGYLTGMRLLASITSSSMISSGNSLTPNSSEN